MLSARSDIISWLNRNGPAWKLYSGFTAEDGKMIESGNTVDSFNYLLSALQPRQYTLKANSIPDSGNVTWNKGFSIIQIDLKPDQAAPMQAPPAIGNIITQDDVNKQIQAALSEHKREQRLAELEAENKELNKQMQDNSAQVGIIKFVNALIPHAPKLGPWIESIITTMIPAPAAPVQAVAGIPATPLKVHLNTNNEENKTEMTDEEQVEYNANRLQAAVEILAENDPNVVETLELLARLVTTNKGMYDMGLSYLKSQVK